MSCTIYQTKVQNKDITTFGHWTKLTRCALSYHTAKFVAELTQVTNVKQTREAIRIQQRCPQG
jgi:hypothetical protein